MAFTMQDSLEFRATLDTSQMEQGLTKAGGKVKRSGASMAAAFGAVAGSVLGIGVALNKVLGDLSDTVDEANKLSAGTGLSVETIGSLEFALAGAGATVKEYETGLRSLVSRMDKGSAAFEELGVQVRDADGNLRNADDVLMETIEGLKGIDDSTRRAALGAELFGVRGQALANILPQVSDELERGAELARTWYGPEAQQASADYDRAVREATVVTRGLETEIATALMPAVTGLAAVWIYSGEVFDEYTTRFAEGMKVVEILTTQGYRAADEYAKKTLAARDGLNMWEAAGKRTSERLQDIFKFGEEEPPAPLNPEVLGPLAGQIDTVTGSLDDQAESLQTLMDLRQENSDAMLRQLEAESDAENERFDTVHEIRMAEIEDRKAAAQEALDIREQERVESLNIAREQAAEELAIQQQKALASAHMAVDAFKGLTAIAEQFGLDTFLVTKATAVAEAVINGLAMALRWGAEGGIPGYIAAGIVVAGQIAAIIAAPRPKYHSGGYAPDEQLSTVRANELVLTGQDQSALLGAIRGVGSSSPSGPSVARLNLNDREADALTALGLRGPRSQGQMQRFQRNGDVRGIA